MKVATRKQADAAVRQVRALRRRIESREATAEERVAAVRDKLAHDCAELKAQESRLTSQLEVWFRDNRKPKQKSIKLQHGVVGMHVVPRVEVPKGAIGKVPRKAVSVRRRINKRALAAMGKKALARAGARIVRPDVFFVRPADEDADK